LPTIPYFYPLLAFFTPSKKNFPDSCQFFVQLTKFQQLRMGTNALGWPGFQEIPLLKGGQSDSGKPPALPEVMIYPPTWKPWSGNPALMSTLPGLMRLNNRE
jgi:hypothetical protein